MNLSLVSVSVNVRHTLRAGLNQAVVFLWKSCPLAVYKGNRPLSLGCFDPQGNRFAFIPIVFSTFQCLALSEPFNAIRHVRTAEPADQLLLNVCALPV
jgi:hypothetical protein